jgi:hypothetical protein
MLGQDVSNHNAFTPAIAAQLKAQGLGRVVIRGGVPWERPGLVEISRQQLQVARDAGLERDVYGWAYTKDSDPDATARVLIDLYDRYAPRRYWIDVEDVDGHAYWDAPGNIAWLQACVATFRAADKPVGIYTGRWYWADHWLGNTTAFADLPLWAATGDLVPDLKGPLFGGWDHLSVEQYDLRGPDRDVFDESLYEGVTVVVDPSVQEQLSYLGGLTAVVLPECIGELETVRPHLALAEDQAALDRAIKALREHSAAPTE